MNFTSRIRLTVCLPGSRKSLIFFASFFAFILGSCDRNTTWTAIGDSITYLNDHADEAGNRITKGYMTLICERHPEVHYTNKGFNGWTSGDIASQIDSLGLAESDVYTIFLGTNDWWQGRPVGTLRDYTGNTGNGTLYGAFRIILDKLKTLNPDAEIILFTPMQRGDFVYLGNFKNNAFGSYKEKNGQTLSQFAEAIKVIAEHENLQVVDLYHESKITPANVVAFKRLRDTVSGDYRNYTYPDYVHIPFDPEKDEYPYPAESIDMTYDGLHPSDKGYVVIANMLEQEMFE